MNLYFEKNRAQRVVTWFAALAALLLWTPLLAAGQSPLPDQEITDAIEDELRYDPAISPATLDIHTENGIVTLRGSTDNLLAKERAARVSETVKGVRSVVNLIQVNPPILRSDEIIEEDVEDALLADPSTESYEVLVRVEDGVVTLTGTVDSWTEKKLAGTITKGVRGVTALENRIDADLSVIRDDHELEREIKRVLRWDVLVDGALMEVEANEGRVTLRGVVGSAAEKRRAVTDAHVAGVASVDASELTVARWARDEALRADEPAILPDREVEEAVKMALRHDPRVSQGDVVVTADDGRITLRGEVESLKAWRAAGNAARHTLGVTFVENRIRVRPEESLGDGEIQSMVREALIRNPYVDGESILVTVTGGIVTLSGSVDSSFQRATADDVAARVSGVVEVENFLSVPAVEAPLVYDPFVYEVDPRGLTWYRFQPFFTTTSDEVIEEAIEMEFFWSPFVDGSDINVMVEDGVATLTGTVDSVRERDDATENAYEGGAVWVDNELIVVR